MASSNPRIIPLEVGWEKEIKEKVRPWLAAFRSAAVSCCCGFDSARIWKELVFSCESLLVLFVSFFIINIAHDILSISYCLLSTMSIDLNAHSRRLIS